MGKTMIKVYGALAALLAILMAVSQGQDYLDGGYVGGGDYGDIGPYFTDPIFTSAAGSANQAAGEIRSMKRTKNVAVLGSMAAKRAASTSKIVADVPGISPANVAGNWSIGLSDGQTIELDLFQSGARIFGRGILASAPTAERASTSGTVDGKSMILNVVPESGTMLYVISLDISGLDLSSSYTLYRADDVPVLGTARARRSP